MATATGLRWSGICDLSEGVRERSKMEERISSYLWKKVNLTKTWVLALINAEQPVMAAAAWTESKEYTKGLEKAVWLACLSQQVTKMGRRIAVLEGELSKVRASAGDSARAEEQLFNELTDARQCILQASESHRYEKEFLQCQVVEAKEREREAQELLAQGAQRYKELEGRFRDIQAAYRVACDELGDGEHGPCQARIEELEEALSKVRGRVHLGGPGGSPRGRGLLAADDSPGAKGNRPPPEAPETCPGRQVGFGLSREGQVQGGSMGYPQVAACPPGIAHHSFGKGNRPLPEMPVMCPGQQVGFGTSREGWVPGGSVEYPQVVVSPTWVAHPGVVGLPSMEGEPDADEAGGQQPQMGQMCPVRQRKYGPPVGGDARGPIESDIIIPHGAHALRGMVTHIPD